jgi:hypothetical protein
MSISSVILISPSVSKSIANPVKMWNIVRETLRKLMYSSSERIGKKCMKLKNELVIVFHRKCGDCGKPFIN